MILIYTFAFITFTTAIFNLSDSYLRYLPFSNKINSDERKKLFTALLIYGGLSLIMYFSILNFFGLKPIVYKLMLIFGGVPFFIIQLKIIKINKWQHLFILGMTSIWNLIIHSISAIIDVAFFSESEIFLYHGAVYLMIFLISLPVAKKFFVNLLPQEDFFSGQPYGKYIVALPFIVMSGVIILWTDNNLIHSWQERFSRIYLPFAFFLFYRYVLTANRQIYNKQQAIRYTKRLREQLSTLREYNQLIQRNQQELDLLQRDTRHNYRLIYTMLQDKRIEEVLEFIRVQENLLNSNSGKIFCHAPLINSALSIYLKRADNLGIKVNYEINLPAELNIEENDMAVLISNLLDNAINASIRQPKDNREISIKIEYKDGRYTLEVMNLFDKKIILNKNGLPFNNRETFGNGMVSLKNFAEKYHAQTDFSHNNGEVKITVQWNDF